MKRQVVPREIQQKNEEILQRLSYFLNQSPDFIKRETIEDITASCHVSTNYAFQVMLAAACGLNTDENIEHKMLFQEYFSHMVQELSSDEYKENPYYKNITFPSVIQGNCQLSLCQAIVGNFLTIFQK